MAGRHSGFTEDKQMLHFPPLPPDLDLTKVPEVNRNHTKASSVFSSSSLTKMLTLILLLVPWAHLQINLPGA